MELRNGSVYTPDLNKHYYYSLTAYRRAKKSPGPKGHSLSHSVDRDSVRSAHSFNLDFADDHSGFGGESSGTDFKAEEEGKEDKEYPVNLLEYSIQEVGKLRKDYLGFRSTLSNVIMKVAEEITEIRTSTTNYLSFSKKEHLFHSSDSMKTSTPVQKHSSKQHETVSYRNSDSSVKKQQHYRQKFTRKKETNTQKNSYNESALVGNEVEHRFSNTLEDHIFHDTSYRKVFGNEKANDSYLASGDESFHYLYKLNGSSLNNYSDDRCDDDGDDLDVDSSFINHYKRSLSRQRRRDWYLNRRNFSGQYTHKEISRIVYLMILIKTFIFFVTKKTTTIFASIWSSTSSNFLSYGNVYNSWSICHTDDSYMILVIRNMYLYFKRKSLSVLVFFKTLLEKSANIILYGSKKILVWIFNSIASTLVFFGNFLNSILKRTYSGTNYVIYQTKEERDNWFGFIFGRHCCVSFFLIICTLPLLLLFLTLNSQAGTTIIVNPSTLFISKSQTIFLGTTGNNIQAWHFLPPSAKLLPPAEMFSDKSPVTLYIHEGHELSSDLQVNIFKTLVSLGYHVIVPVNVLNDEEVSVAWSWIKEKAPQSSTYLWGDHLDPRILTGYAKDFCSQLIPADGVIIETDVPKSSHTHRSLEIWSCNCTSVPSKIMEGSYHRYTHVKCPLSDVDSSPEDIYNHIVACIAAVNKGE